MRCSRSGCGKEFSEGSLESCTYHSGKAVFHEGLKSWSCCEEVNKPVLDFESFLALPGCSHAPAHTVAAPSATPDSSKATRADGQAATKLKMTAGSDGTEVYSTAPAVPVATPSTQAAAPAEVTTVAPLEEDDLSVAVPPGTKCQRKGCDKSFVSDEISRNGDGDGAICNFHSAPPIFREGSKGYLCCKRRVLEFDEFLKIPGCKTGHHLFVSKNNSKDTSQTEQVTCRIDHYQTPREVFVSVFAKQADKQKTVVRIENEHVWLDVVLPASKRFTRTLDLYGPVDSDSSSYSILNTKVEIKLTKRDIRSWNALEKTSASQSLNLTFGVGGRTGTVGGKDLIVDPSSQKSP